MLQSFVYAARQPRVIFGTGTMSHLPEEIDKLAAHRVLLLTTPKERGLADPAAELLGGRVAGLFDRAVMHVPTETAEAARQIAADLEIDCLVAIGGGSTVGLAKAIALVTELPIVAIPTTYAGSEMTTIYGMTEGGLKKTGKNPCVLPKTVIYDPRLTLKLSLETSIASGLNAVAHCAEGLYAQDGNPVAALMAEEGIRSLAAGLKLLRATPQSLEARSDCLYGAWLSGMVLGSVGMALHHKFCHTLGGTYGLPHAETHAVVLPHAFAYNAPAAPLACERVCRALGASHGDAGAALYDLALELGAPTSLQALNMREGDLEEAVDLTLTNPYWNPRPLERAAILSMLQDAFFGKRPTSSTTI